MWARLGDRVVREERSGAGIRAWFLLLLLPRAGPVPRTFSATIAGTFIP